MPQRVVGTMDSPKYTVAEMVADPLRIPRRVIRLSSQEYLPDRILRDAGTASAGVITFRESDPLFANDDVPIVAEFGEIPVTTVNIGQPKAVRTVKRAEAIEVSYEMVSRNNTGEVTRRINLVKNSMVRTYNVSFIAQILANSSVQQMAASAVWGAGSAVTHIRADVAGAKFLVNESDADTSNGTGTQKFEFAADTLILNTTTAESFESNDELSKIFYNTQFVKESPLFTGEAPNTLSGLRVIVSRQCPANKAIVLESKTCGGIADERPMGATPLYNHPQRELWRSDVSRMSAMFLDQPKAITVISGVDQ